MVTSLKNEISKLSVRRKPPTKNVKKPAKENTAGRLNAYTGDEGQYEL